VNTRAIFSGVSHRMTKTRLNLDPATLFGLVCGFGLLSAAIVLGGSPRSFVNAPSILLVIGGTFSVVTVSYSLAEVINTFRVVGKTIVWSSRDPSEAAVSVIKTAEIARRQGVLALQNHLDKMSDEPFLQKGLSLVVDGAPTAEIEEVLRRDLVAGVSNRLSIGGGGRRVDLGGSFVLTEHTAPRHFEGRTLKDLNIRQRAGLQVLLIRAASGAIRVPTADDRIAAGDRLVVAGPRDAVDGIARL